MGLITTIRFALARLLFILLVSVIAAVVAASPAAVLVLVFVGGIDVRDPEPIAMSILLAFTGLAFLAAINVRIVTWVLSIAMLLTLGLGSFFTSVYLAYQAPLGGYLAWYFTTFPVAVLGMLALITTGRVLEAIGYLVVSVVVNWFYFGAQLGLSTLAPVLVIPPALALNGAYIYLAWRLLLSPQAHRTARPRLNRIRDSLRGIWESRRQPRAP